MAVKAIRLLDSLAAALSPHASQKLTREKHCPVHSWIATSQQKVRITVSLGPPNWTKSRTFEMTFALEL